MTSPAKANGDRELISSDRRAPPSPPPHALVPRGARHVFIYSSSLGIGVIPEHDFDSGHVPSVTVGLGRRHETGSRRRLRLCRVRCRSRSPSLPTKLLRTRRSPPNAGPKELVDNPRQGTGAWASGREPSSGSHACQRQHNTRPRCRQQPPPPHRVLNSPRGHVTQTRRVATAPEPPFPQPLPRAVE